MPSKTQLAATWQGKRNKYVYKRSNSISPAHMPHNPRQLNAALLGPTHERIVN